MRLFTKINSTDRGATMVEYGLIVAVISMMSVSAVTLLGDNTEESFEAVAEAMDTGQAPDGTPVSSSAEDESADDAADDSAHEQSSDDGSYDEDDSDEQGSEDGSQDDDGGAQPNDEESNDTSGDDSEGTVSEQDPEVTPTNTSSSITKWNANKHGGNGKWKASVSYENGSMLDQYLSLKVTTVDDKGKTKTTQVDSFYVPASDSATFDHLENLLKDHKGKVTGIMEVHIEVVNIETYDEKGNPVSFPQENGPISTIKAPPAP